MIIALRAIAALLLGVLLLWSLLSGIFNAGLVFTFLYVGSGFFLLFFPWRHLQTPLLRNLCFVCAVGYSIFTLIALCLFGWMLHAASHTPDAVSPHTVIVLGCQVQGDQPSKMLARRLDTAYEYLSAHPESSCVLSGGQGENEELPEAVVMRQYLIDRGVQEKRLYIETRSQSTSENLAFSASLIREQGLSDQVVVVTDGFHQLRGQWFAEKNGLTATGLSSRTSWNMLACYYVREILAVGKMFLFGQ